MLTVMCGRYVLSQPGDVLDETLESLAGFELKEVRDSFEPRFNVAPTQTMPIVLRTETREQPAKSRQLQLASAQWQFKRARARAGAKSSPLINARCETLEERPSFERSFRYRRCLVPASGFYEWRPRGNRQPFYFSLPQESGRAGFCFAGLWQPREPTADHRDAKPGFCIVTGKAGPAMSEIHHRRPVILEPTHYLDWLDPDKTTAELHQLLQSNDPSLERHPVGFAVNRVANDDASLIELAREAPTNLSLF